jgi:hypothetical protein
VVSDESSYKCDRCPFHIHPNQTVERILFLGRPFLYAFRFDFEDIYRQRLTQPILKAVTFTAFLALD